MSGTMAFILKKKLKLTTMLYDFREKRLKKLSDERIRSIVVAVALIAAVVTFFAVACRPHKWQETENVRKVDTNSVESHYEDFNEQNMRPEHKNHHHLHDYAGNGGIATTTDTTLAAIKRLLLRHPTTPRPTEVTTKVRLTEIIGDEFDQDIDDMVRSFEVSSGSVTKLRTRVIDHGIMQIAPTGDDEPDVLVGVTLPLHNFNDTSLRCSYDIVPTAFTDLMGVLTLIDEVNADKGFMKDVTFGVLLIDSCSSHAFVKKRIFKAMKHFGNTQAGEIAITFMGFVSSLNLVDEQRALIESTANFHVAAISAKDLTVAGIALGMNKGVFQIQLPIEQLLLGALHQMKYLNYSKVSLVKEMNDHTNDNYAIYDHFMQLATEHEICVVNVYEADSQHQMSIDTAVSSLLNDKHQFGAQAVVMLTNFNTSRKLFEKLANNLNVILIKEGNLNVVRGIEPRVNERLLIVNEQRNNLRSFLTNFNQNMSLFMPSKQLLEKHHKITWKLDIKSTLNTMQAMISLVSGFARLRDNFCGDRSGLCSRLTSGLNLRPKLNYYIQYTAAMKLDSGDEDVQQLFSFRKEGYGAKNVDIMHFKEDMAAHDVKGHAGMTFRQPSKYFFEKVARYYDTFERIGNTTYGDRMTMFDNTTGSVTARCVTPKS